MKEGEEGLDEGDVVFDAGVAEAFTRVRLMIRGWVSVRIRMVFLPVRIGLMLERYCGDNGGDHTLTF